MLHSIAIASRDARSVTPSVTRAERSQDNCHYRPGLLPPLLPWLSSLPPRPQHWSWRSSIAVVPIWLMFELFLVPLSTTYVQYMRGQKCSSAHSRWSRLDFDICSHVAPSAVLPRLPTMWSDEVVYVKSFTQMEEPFFWVERDWHTHMLCQWFIC